MGEQSVVDWTGAHEARSSESETAFGAPHADQSGTTLLHDRIAA
jgi:hypothetical protein